MSVLLVAGFTVVDYPEEGKATWRSELHPRKPDGDGGGRFVRRRPARSIGNTHHALPDVPRHNARARWGYSRSGSFAVTGASAQVMGIPGFRTFDDDEQLVAERQAVATRFLREIHDSKLRSRGRRFHGTSGTQWADVQAGDMVDVPLTATADSQTHAIGYSDKDKAKYLVVFPAGTRGAGISETRDVDTDQPTGEWDEMVVAGRFRVVSRFEVTNNEGSYTRVELEPVAVFNTVHKRWDKVRTPEREPDHGHPELVAQLRDQGAQVNDDATVSVWPIPNRNRWTQAERPMEYTTSRQIAAERAEWASDPEPEELRVPLAQVTILDLFGDEARLDFDLASVMTS